MNLARLYIILRYVVGISFILAGIGKIIDSTTAAATLGAIIRDMFYVSPEHDRTMALSLATVEIFLGVFVLWRKNKLWLQTRINPLLVPSFICWGYFYYLPPAFVLFKGQDIPFCGGFGFFDFALNPVALIIRIIVLLIAMFYLAYYEQQTNEKSFKGIFAKRT